MFVQGEIDELGGGKTIRDWEARFELAYEKCKDEKRAWVPNYDLFFFEVETRTDIKMPHEMQAPTKWSLGEIGRLVVSTPILPRYKIGDLIRAFRPPYFCCIGRDQWWTPLRYAWDEFMTLDLRQL